MTDINQPTIAMIYAEALFDLAHERQAALVIADDLDGIAQTCRALPGFVLFLECPVIGASRKEKSIETIFAGRVHPLTMDFLRVVCRKERLACLPGISQSYQALLRREAGVVQGVLTTAVALTGTELEQITRTISAVSGKQIELEHRIDPLLLGGMTLTLDGMLIDGSVKHRLHQFSRNLMAGIQERGGLTETKFLSR